MFELEKFVKDITKGRTKDPAKPRSGSGFLSDSLKVSLFMAAVIVLIIYLMFKNIVDEDVNFFSVMFKVGLFTLITIISGVFLHSKHLEQVYDDKYSDKTSKETVQRSISKDHDDVSVAELPASSTPSTPSVPSTPSTTPSIPNTIPSDRNENPLQVNVNINGATP
jgi:hypothetical protein